MKYKCKPYILKRCFSFFIAVCCLFSVNTYVSAHELYYDSNEIDPIVPFRWTHKTGTGKVYMTIGITRTLGDTYASIDDVAISAWDIACPEIVTSFAKSNPHVTLTESSMSNWMKRFPGYYKSVLGVCDITTTDGVTVKDEASARRSNGKIKSAYIQFTPYTEVFKNNNIHVRAVMVHEIGHALGLGHPGITSLKSIMRAVPPTTWYMPVDHDKQDVRAWY